MLQRFKRFNLSLLIVNLSNHISLKVSILLLESVRDIGVFNHQILETIDFLVLRLLVGRK
jgi:hypothetical protein